MKLFYANQNTLIYEQTLELNPRKNWEIPFYVSTIPIPTNIPSGKLVKLNISDKSWGLVDDPESIEAYNKITKEKIIVKKNSIPETFTELKPNTQDDIFYNGKWDLESNVISELKKKMISLINTRTRNKINSGYESSILGQPHIYDSSLTDQFEIDFLSRQNSGYKIKCTPPDGIKRRILHTSTQINQLANEFMLYVSELKVVADGEKTSILENPYTIQELELMIESIS